MESRTSHPTQQFRLDLDGYQLLDGNSPVRLEKQPMELLILLAKRRGQLVTRDEIAATLWSDGVFVDTDRNINSIVRKLRQALQDDPDHPRFVETVVGKGYRFVGPLEIASRQEDSSSGAGPTPLAPPVARPKILWKVLLAAAAVIASLAVTVLVTFAPAGGWFWRSRHGRVLSEKDTIVLTDFSNTTGDPVFDGALKQGLRVELEQSPFLNIVSDQRVSEKLRLMRHPPDERLTPELARDLCQRVGSKAILTGSISSLGTHYVIGLNALSCGTGDELGSEQAEADSREHVLNALGESAARMRRKLGESLASIQKYDVGVSRTTSSLEALKVYSAGMETWYVKGSAAAIPYYQRAVELDPKFAAAHGRLGQCYGNLGEDGLATEEARKAYELRESLTEPEQLYVEGHYHDTVTGDLEKAEQVYELWHQIYPREEMAPHILISVYGALGKFDDALREGDEAMRLEPRNIDTEDWYFSVTPVYIFLNQFDRAEELLRQAEEHRVEDVGLLSFRYMLAFLKDDVNEMQRVAASAAGRPSMEAVLLDDEACAKAYHGRLGEAREIFRRSVELAQQNGDKERAADNEVDASLTEAYLGDAQDARKDADVALKLARNRYVGEQATLALALAGNTTRAEELATELNKSFPLDTTLQRYSLPTIRAATALQRGNATKVSESLGAKNSGELTTAGGLTPLGLVDATYVRGQAYLLLHNGNAAAVQFQKILDHPGLVLISPVGALAHLGLARAYVLQGNNVKARAKYQDFLMLWKDADPNIPILKQAKAEYEKLR